MATDRCFKGEVEQAIMVAMREFRDLVERGWPIATPERRSSDDDESAYRHPDQVWIDAGYMTNVVYDFCCESEGQRYRPAVGRGAAQQRRQYYSRPAKTSHQVKHIGQGFHISRLRSPRIDLVEIDADYWKTWVHQRLATPMGQPGAMSFYRAAPNEHLALAKHLTAQAKREEFVAGRGVVTKWERVRRQNHWFDTLYNACAAGYFCGARLLGETVKRQPAKRRPFVIGGLCLPDGRPWIDVERWRQMNRFG